MINCSPFLYKCPVCHNYGLASIYWNMCTACANEKRFGYQSSIVIPKVRMGYDDDYSAEDYEYEKETGRCRYCGRPVDECICNEDWE